MHLYPNQNLTMSNIHVETDRLYLRDFEKKDAKALFEMESDPEVHRYLGNKPLTDISQLDEVIDWIHQQYRENGIGRWICELKTTGEIIGWCGLKIEKKIRPFEYYDLGYRFNRRFWRKGYGNESAQACLNYAFETLKWETVNAAAEQGNAGSKRIIQKLGFTQLEPFEFEGVMCNWYELQKRDWESFLTEF